METSDRVRPMWVSNTIWGIKATTFAGSQQTSFPQSRTTEGRTGKLWRSIGLPTLHVFPPLWGASILWHQHFGCFFTKSGFTPQIHSLGNKMNVGNLGMPVAWGVGGVVSLLWFRRHRSNQMLPDGIRIKQLDVRQLPPACCKFVEPWHLSFLESSRWLFFSQQHYA